MSSVWNSALNILARREHSRAELQTKLERKFPEDIEEIPRVLDRLVELGLQSDERYAEMWLRSQIAKGRGPVRIIGEARQRGIGQRIEALLHDQEYDWFEAALDVARRKFPSGIVFEQQPKLYRYLAYRGFSSDEIRYAVESLKE